MTKEKSGEERYRQLEQKVDEISLRLTKLENDVTDALRAIFDILSQGGPIDTKLVAVEQALGKLHADLHLSEDTLGDAQTISGIESSLGEIKRKVGINS